MLLHLAKGTLKKKIASTILVAATFSLSAGCTFFMIPQTTINERDNAPAIIEEDPKPTTGRERFVSNLTNVATSGLSIDAKELVLEYDGKTVGQGAPHQRKRNPKRGFDTLRRGAGSFRRIGRMGCSLNKIHSLQSEPVDQIHEGTVRGR
jgi:hypothetical protein